MPVQTHLRRVGSAGARPPRVVVIGAGLGGLAVALRLQGAGHEVTVLEQRCDARRARLAVEQRRLHVGHRPVPDHDAVGAGGDLRRRRAGPARRGPAAPARSALPDPVGGRGAHVRLHRRPRTDARADRPLRRARRARARRLPGRAEADLRAGHPRGGTARVRRPALVRALLPTMVRLGASLPLHRFVAGTSGIRECARRSRSIRCSSAATRSACRRSTPRSPTCRCSTEAGTPTAASTRWWRRWRGRWTCAAARAWRRSSARATASAPSG